MKSKRSWCLSVLIGTAAAVCVCVIAQAQTYNGKCIPAKKSTKLDELGGSCYYDSEGKCCGSVTLSEAAVHGYCDATESGTCTVTTGGILLGSATVNCSEWSYYDYGSGAVLTFVGCHAPKPQTFSTTTLVYVPSCQ